MNYSDGVSQTALAANLGISRVQVRRLIDKGIFRIDDSKKISLSDAKKAYEQYQETVEQKKRNQKRREATKLIDALKNSSSEFGDDFNELFNQWITLIEDDPIAVMNSAKAYLTALQTKEQKMKVDEAEKRLIPIERIHHDAEEAAALVRSKLITIPSRVATICEGRSARDIEEIIEDEINSSLAELQKLYAVGE